MSRSGKVLTVVACGAAAVSALWLPSAAPAYKRSAATKQVIQRMLAVLRSAPAVKVVHTGAVFYCPAFVAGYSVSLRPQCQERARVIEEDDLAQGSIVRAEFRASAAGRPTIRAMHTPAGFETWIPDRSCWVFTAHRSLPMRWVSFAPKERVMITATTPRTTVLKTVASHHTTFTLTIDNRTGFPSSGEQINHVNGKTYREHVSYTLLSRASPPLSTTPSCR